MCQAGFGGSTRGRGVHCFYETLAGGYGGRDESDGPDAVQAHSQNTENAPVEETELNYPVRILGLSLVEDSEGPGRRRGGLGLRRDYLFDLHTTFTVLADRDQAGPWGAFGGHSGAGAEYVHVRDGARRGWARRRPSSSCPATWSASAPAAAAATARPTSASRRGPARRPRRQGQPRARARRLRRRDRHRDRRDRDGRRARRLAIDATKPARPRDVAKGVEGAHARASPGRRHRRHLHRRDARSTRRRARSRSRRC